MANDSSVRLNTAVNPFVVGRVGELSGDKEINLRQLLDLLRAGRNTVLLVAAAVVVLVAAYCVVVSPTYEADGLVQIEPSSKGTGVAQQMSDISALLEGTPVETQAEIQVLHSRMILGQVIDKLNMQIVAKPKLFPIIGGAIYRSNQLAKEPVSAPAFLRSYAWGGESVVVSTWDVPDTFLNKAFVLTRVQDGFTIDIPGYGRLLEGKIGETATVENAAGAFTVFVRELHADPGTKFTLVRFARQDVLDRLSKDLRILELGHQSGVITIAYDGPSRDAVTEVVNAVEDSYLRQNVERRSATAQQSLDYLQKQLPQLKESVDNAQLRLNAYQSTHGSVDVTEETQLVLKQTVNLDSQRLQLQQQREELLQRFTPEHPAVKALDEQIRSLDNAKGQVTQKVQHLPNTQQEIFSLMRDLDVSNALYAQMLNSIQELQVAKAGTVGNVRIVDRALRPFKPVRPKVVVLMAVSIVLGLFLGVVTVFIQRAMVRGVDDPAELESKVGLVTYAMIPFSHAQKKINRAISRGESGNHILASISSEDLAIEALRSLRTSLHFALLEAANNIVMLTGPAPGMGKSFVSLNLGALLALSGKKVVVVDGDLRKGHLHRYISAEVSPGISEYIAGLTDFQSIVTASPIAGLDIVFRGAVPPNPAELLMNSKFAELFNQLSSKYDYVIVDTPPILAVADAGIVGRLAGSTLMVLKSAEHSLREIEETLKRLATSGVTVKGAIFNQVGMRAGSYGYGGYGYKYYQYGSDESGKPARL